MTTAYLMNKPDGWKAKYANNVLTVTAPSEAAIESGAADKEGEVLIHCTTSEGKCKVARLVVSMTPEFVFTVTEDGKVTIVNPEVVTTTHPMTGMTRTDFNSIFMGFAPVSKFEADPLQYVSTIENNYDDLSWQLESFKSTTTEYDEETWEPIYKFGRPYDPENYTVDRIEATVNDFHNYIAYSDVPKGTTYVFWACPADSEGSPRLVDLSYVYYSVPVEATITAIEGGVSVNDIEVEVKVDGATSYYVGMIPDEYMMDYMTGQKYTIDEYMVSNNGPFGYMQYMLDMGAPMEYAAQAMGTLFGGETGEEMSATIKASVLNNGFLTPETKVYMWVFPIIDGLDLASYTYEENLKPYIYEFTTSGLQAGGAETVSLEAGESTFDQIAVNVIPSDGATSVYYKFYSADEFETMSAADVVSTGIPADASYEIVARQDVSGPGVEMTLAAVAVDADYKYGELAVLPVSSKILEYNDSFVAEFGEPVYTKHSNGVGYSYDFPVTVTGGTAVKYYRVFSTTEYTDEQLKNLPLGSNGGFYDGFTSGDANKLNGVYANASTTYYLYVVVESLDGKFSKVIKKTVDVPAIPAAE
jgi:hypothetical protein